MKRRLQVSCMAACLLLAWANVSAQTDITDLPGGTYWADSSYDYGDSENYPKLFDNNPNTKYYVDAATINVYFYAQYAFAITRYALTSANDASTRDPRAWTLEGSADGSTWVALNSRSNQDFATRFQRREFTVTGAAKYKNFRLRITQNHGAGDLQFAELELISDNHPTGTPTNLATALQTNNKVNLTWTDNANNETAMLVERSVDGSKYLLIKSLAANTQSFLDSGLAANKQYVYRIRAENANGVSNPSTPAIIRTAAITTQTDITDFTNGVMSDYYNKNDNEGRAMVVDNNPHTKYYNGAAYCWLRYYLSGGAIVKAYAITSANDEPGRDPKNWQIQGSNNGTSWTVLDTKTNQAFANRKERRLYAMPYNTTTYTYYRIEVTATLDNSGFQIAEWELFGTGTGTSNNGAPVAPTGISSFATSGYQNIISWTDAAKNETGYRVEMSTDSVNWSYQKDLPANDNTFYSRGLTPFTKYYYRVRATNAAGNSAWVFTTRTTTTGEAPLTWTEHWGDHNENLSRVYYDQHIAVYYDPAVSTSINWMFSNFTAAWQYVKQNYGSFSDPRLYMIFHSVNKPHLSGGHAVSPYNADHDYRNAVDLSGGWATRSTWNVGATTHEIGHIVEGASKNVNHSPTFGLWGDSKWCEIFNYDIYKRMGWTQDASDLYTEMQTQYDNFPRANTQWFKNWFYPIYTRADSSAALNRYFTLLSQYFPQYNGGYARGLNMGEMVHFWSGAAQYNLRNQADTAFGWNEQYELEFQQAKLDFPFTYPDQLLLSQQLAVTPVVKSPLNALWPNPAAGVIYLNGPDPAKLYTVEAFSMAGVRVLTTRTSGSNAPLNIAGLSTGVYVFVVSDNQGVVFTKKIVINK